MGFIRVAISLPFWLVGVPFLLGGMLGEGNGNRLLGLGVGSLCCLIGYKVWPSSSGETWRNDPATEKQKSFADDLGIRYPKNISKGDMSDLITEETGR